MLTEAELRKMLTDLESETVERTRAFDKADKMGQAISAFANDLGEHKKPGYLLLGVENDGRISGKRIDDEQLTSLGGRNIVAAARHGNGYLSFSGRRCCCH